MLVRLWDEELARGSSVLRRSTLDELGGAEEIVRQHLDRVMRGFTLPELAVLADAFGHLVTPSGSKIAHRPSDLATLTEHDPTQMADLLRRLASREQRILRDVPPPLDDPHGEVRYEIFHDVLALAVLDWRRRYMAEAEAQAQQQALLAQTRQARRRLRLVSGIAAAMALLIVVGLVAAVIAVRSLREADREAERADRNAALDEVNRLLGTDPSEALREAMKKWQPGSSEAYEDSFRRALDVSDTEVRLDLGSPVVTSMFLGGTGLVTVTEDGFVRVWSATDEDDRYRVREKPELELDVTDAASERVTQAVVTGDGKFLVARSDAGAVIAVDLESDDGSVKDLENRFGDGGGLSAASDAGSRVAIWDVDGKLALWDPGDPTFTFSVDDLSIYSAAVSPSGTHLAVVSRRRDRRPRRARALQRRRREADQAAAESRGLRHRVRKCHLLDDSRVQVSVGDLSYVATWDWEAQAKPVRVR